jgi:hypothetical protein
MRNNQKIFKLLAFFGTQAYYRAQKSPPINIFDPSFFNIHLNIILSF